MDKIRFRNMTEEEYKEWEAWSVADYAETLLETGQAAEEGDAMRKAREDFGEELIRGMDTEGHFLFVIENPERKCVGYLWYERADSNVAFLEDIRIVQTERGKGYARQALHQMEERMRSAGVKKIVLRVFANNRPARTLYETCGFQYVRKEGVETGSLYMEKVPDGDLYIARNDRMGFHGGDVT